MEFPDQNTGVGSLSLLQGIFPAQGLNSSLPHCWLSHRESGWISDLSFYSHSLTALFHFFYLFPEIVIFFHPHLIEQWMFFNQDYCKSIDVIIIQKWSRFTLSLLINFCKSEGSRNLSTSILYGKGFSSVQSLSDVQLFVTPSTAAHQASLSIFQNLLKLTPIELVMPSSHLILCHPLLLPPSIFPRIRVFQMSQLFTSGG